MPRTSVSIWWTSLPLGAQAVERQRCPLSGHRRQRARGAGMHTCRFDPAPQVRPCGSSRRPCASSRLHGSHRLRVPLGRLHLRRAVRAFRRRGLSRGPPRLERRVVVRDLGDGAWGGVSKGREQPLLVHAACTPVWSGAVAVPDPYEPTRAVAWRAVVWVG